MSFSSEQKDEIMAQPIKSLCCKRAFLCGVLTSRAELTGEGVRISLATRKLADEIGQVVRDVFTKQTEITTLAGGGRGYSLSFRSPSAERMLASFIDGGEFFTEKCKLCHSYFLRGIFIASGRITDPTKQYMLEFAVKNSTERFMELFAELGIDPRLSQKPKERVIYFRNSSAIEDFLALAAVNNTIFALMNAKIQGEIRNNVNRISNCETNNINKAVLASSGQIAVIHELVKTGLISQLPDELQKTAMLRMEHSDLSLSQLAAIITPYISKPGLSHRLKRITELGKELLERSKKHN